MNVLVSAEAEADIMEGIADVLVVAVLDERRDPAWVNLRLNRK